MVVILKGGNMEIKLMIKNVFGNELVYPVCYQAKALAKLKGTKTFNDVDLTIIKDLGYKFKWVALTKEVA